MLSCFREAQAYRRASRRVRQTQSDVLRKIVARNRDTWFGKRHRFASIRDVKDFRQSVPLSTYEDYAEPVQRIMRGEQKVLTSEPVELLEPTSGTTSGEKLIPYTASLKRSFQRAIRVWIGDLFYNRSDIRSGKAYWSISPLAKVRRTTQAGIPIGFDDDASYLGTYERRLLAKTLAVPPEVALCQCVASAQYATLFFLLQCPGLSLVSVWSPTFLNELLHTLLANWEQLSEDVESGAITTKWTQQLPDSLSHAYRPQPERANQIRGVMSHTPLDSTWVKQIWPGLSMVSCWTDGPSSAYATDLSHSLSGIEIQPKGLLATEAFVSIPLLAHPSAGLAVRSHFFEFQPVHSSGVVAEENTVFAEELQIGEQYQVVVTTDGGLYRYQLMDQVEVVGFNEQIPLLRFLGKCDDTTDLVGEKLNAAQVQSVLERALNAHQLAPTYFDFFPQPGNKSLSQNPVEGCQRLGGSEQSDGFGTCSKSHYVLRIADQQLAGNKQMQVDLCESIDASLRSNPGYNYARDLGQLEKVKIVNITQEEANRIDAQRTKELLLSGIRHGNAKPSVLRKSAAF